MTIIAYLDTRISAVCSIVKENIVFDNCVQRMVSPENMSLIVVVGVVEAVEGVIVDALSFQT